MSEIIDVEFLGQDEDGRCRSGSTEARQHNLRVLDTLASPWRARICRHTLRQTDNICCQHVLQAMSHVCKRVPCCAG